AAPAREKNIAVLVRVRIQPPLPVRKPPEQSNEGANAKPARDAHVSTRGCCRGGNRVAAGATDGTCRRYRRRRNPRQSSRHTAASPPHPLPRAGASAHPPPTVGGAGDSSPGSPSSQASPTPSLSVSA